MHVQKILQYHEAWHPDAPVGFTSQGEIETVWVCGLLALDAALAEQGSDFCLVVLHIDPTDSHLCEISRRITALAPQATIAMCNRRATFGPVAA